MLAWKHRGLPPGPTGVTPGPKNKGENSSVAHSSVLQPSGWVKSRGNAGWSRCSEAPGTCPTAVPHLPAHKMWGARMEPLRAAEGHLPAWCLWTPGFLFGASCRPALEPYRRAGWLLPRAAGRRGRGSKLPGCYGFQGGPRPGSTGSWGGSGLGLTHSNHPQALRWEEVKLMGPWPIFRRSEGPQTQHIPADVSTGKDQDQIWVT